MNVQEAAAKIAELIAQAESLITEAENISNTTGVGFNWSGPSYGMGGWYEPSGEYEGGYGWMASSQSC